MKKKEKTLFWNGYVIIGTHCLYFGYLLNFNTNFRETNLVFVEFILENLFFNNCRLWTKVSCYICLLYVAPVSSLEQLQKQQISTDEERSFVIQFFI